MHVSRGKQVRQLSATAELRGPLTARARLSALQWLKNRDPTELRRCATDQRRSSHCLCPAWVCRATAAVPGGQDAPSLADGSVSIILLAGGVGKRMGAAIPKQYLDLRGSPIATYSLRTFSKMREVLEIIIVCEPSWRALFQQAIDGLPRAVPIKWALPGSERQDSVFSGLQQVATDAALVAVHDSARPLVTAHDALRCFQDGLQVGAAVLGVPVKPTIKEVDAQGLVVKTLQRSKLWEVQTPQVIRTELLRNGFALVKAQGLDVTDDVSIIEALGKPVRVTPGSYTNIKVTTPEDMSVAEGFLDEQAAAAAMAANPIAAVSAA
ncbi:2-C-methyl-D-erythritol 4-phosphate cytidylyltransferase-domain-containing protein [Haematococcus lacustris]